MSEPFIPPITPSLLSTVTAAAGGDPQAVSSVANAMGGWLPEGQQSGVIREAPDVTDARRALVTKLIKSVTEAKRKYQPAFKAMREDLKFVRRQRANQTLEDNRARVNVIQRHIANKVAALYAKNPTFVASAKKRLEFAIWDGSSGQIAAMLQELQTSPPGVGPSPMTQALFADVQQGVSRKQMLAGVARTLEVIMAWSLAEQSPPFKPRAKRLVRRAVTMGVGYVKLGYQRQLAKRPDVEAKLADVTDRLAQLERLQADQQDGKLDDYSAEAEQLRVTQAQLDNEAEAVVREGLVVDFPHSTRIIPDTGTKELVGWVGTGWLAEEFLMTAEEVQETYGVDLRATGGYTGYKLGEYGATAKSDAKDKLACVWEVYHRKDGVVYVVCDGFPDFLKEPEAPAVAVEQFFPVYPLIFNEAENEDELFPPSDVEYLRPIQNEINRKREALRQHRMAARPFYIGQRGKFSDEDLKDLNSVNEHEIVFTNALDATEKIENVIQSFPTKTIDPNLYEVQNDINDMQLVAGAQQATMGKVGDSTATESSIAETSRLSSLSSNIDDLDEFLSLLARDAGAILLKQLTHDTAAKVAGPGAVWPELSAQDIAEEVFLDIEAGSSGRPNKEQDLANLERIVPMLLQIPGINPGWLAKQMVKTLDAKIDLEEAITSGLPAILTMNKQAQVSTGNAATDPNAQGDQGGDNAAKGDQPEGGPQAAYPAASTAQPNAGGAVPAQ
jgi:hypothetical protein